ncbi:MAG TPA: alkaline phosphatase family protein [Thermoanaerobaculia bacterium]|nr:alkaline phosphatase family protein [Thermoanaerobaculia bacterium]
MAADPRIEHIVVLMMENRSFDHMLGFIDHPGVEKLQGNESNLDAQSQPVTVTPNAGFENGGDPSHQHFSVMFTITGKNPSGTPPHYERPYDRDMSGFVRNYAKTTKTDGHDVMLCQPETNVPVLTTLAKEFAICDHWFASVPGQTWPNRLFVHSATSGGTSNNELSLYSMTTVFRRLHDAKKTWAIFHHGDAQSLCFPALWDKPWKRDNFNRMPEFFRRVREDKLPHYSFIEPNQLGEGSNSQHPNRNKRGSGGVDFRDGERLIGEIYNALIANPGVWQKTLLVITYDEHGGFYDHVQPEPAVPPDATIGKERFGFDLLGVRVPAVLISPYIKRGKVDKTIYDHTSVIATLCEQFGARSLTKRDEKANTFLHNLELQQPRLGNDIPPEFVFPDLEGVEEEDPTLEERPEDDELDMLWLMQQVDRILAEERAGMLEGASESAVLEAMEAPARRTFETKREAGEYADEVMSRFEQSTAMAPESPFADEEW